MMEKRTSNIKTDRLFLTVNKSWNEKNSLGFFKNSPVGRNELSKWTKLSAESIGLDTKRVKITNHSNRVSAVSHLAKVGVGEHQITKITGHKNASSIKSYLQLDENHHKMLMQNMRNIPVENQTSSSSFISHEQIQEPASTSITSLETKPIIHYHNCTFSNNSNCNFS